MTFSPSAVARLLEPTSVAIVGASDAPERIGGRPLQYLSRVKGIRVHPVRPGAERVQGVPAVDSLGDLTEPVDLCIFATSATITVDQFEKYAGRAFRAALVFAGGFAETSGAGVELQARLARFATERGVPVLGPNCLGFGSVHSGVLGSFASAFESIALRPGGVALLSQGGGFAINLLVEAATRNVGLSRMISTGNEAVLDTADLLGFLADDDHTERVVCIMEGTKDPQRLGAAMKRLQDAGKPLHVLKIGRTRAGAASVSSHTALAAGDDAAFGALLRRYGGVRLNTVNEAIDVIQVRPRPSQRLVVATMSGGAAGYMADLSEQAGLELSPLGPGTARELKKILPGFGTVANPIDLTGQIINDRSLLDRSLSLLMSEPDAGRIALFLGGMATAADEIVSTLFKLQSRHPAELVVCWLGVDESIRSRARQSGLTVFDDPARLFAAWRLVRPEPQTAHSQREDDREEAHSESVNIMGEAQVLSWMSKAGIAVPPSAEARSVMELQRAAEQLTFPLVMKVSEPAIAHRAQAGGVVMGLRDAKDLESAWREFTVTLDARRVLLAEQISGSGEILIGMLRDPLFGVTGVVGTGGVMTNQAGTHLNLIKPFDIDYLRETLAALPDWLTWCSSLGDEDRLLARIRAVLDALEEFLDAHPWATEVELNPLLVTPGQLVAVDGLALA